MTSPSFLIRARTARSFGSMTAAADTAAAARMMTTRFTQRFPCTLPLVGAPMNGVSGGWLAAETCRAGALGFLAVGHTQVSDLEFLEKQIPIFREHASGASSANNNTKQQFPLCLGVISHSTFGSAEGWKRFESILEQYQPDVVQFFAPAVCHYNDNDDKSSHNSMTNISLAQRYNALVLTQVGSVAEAQQALAAGTDGIMVQGSEAGGHGLRRELGNAVLPLAQSVIHQMAAKAQAAKATTTNKDDNDDDHHNDKNRVPVLAAGGIVNGAGVAAALAAKCDGAVLGTRLWATREALGHVHYKQRLVETASCDNVLRTAVFDQIQNSYAAAGTAWPWPYDSVGAIRNATTQQWDQDDAAAELAAAIAGDEHQQPQPDSNSSSSSLLVRQYRQAQTSGDPDIALVHSGQGVGLVDSSDESVYNVVTRIHDETVESIQNLSKLLSSS